MKSNKRCRIPQTSNMCYDSAGQYTVMAYPPSKRRRKIQQDSDKLVPANSDYPYEFVDDENQLSQHDSHNIDSSEVTDIDISVSESAIVQQSVHQRIDAKRQEVVYCFETVTKKEVAISMDSTNQMPGNIDEYLLRALNQQ